MTWYHYVQDGDSPSARTATALVQVSVEDGDDQGPVFVYPGCWTHRARCSWPKYTTTTVLKQVSTELWVYFDDFFVFLFWGWGWGGDGVVIDILRDT